MRQVIELERQGYAVSLQGDRIQIQKKVGFSPDARKVRGLLHEIREQKADAIRYLTRCRWSIWCDRRQPPRWVSYPVCAYHIEKQDPVCQGCKPGTMKRKEIRE